MPDQPEAERIIHELSVMAGVLQQQNEAQARRIAKLEGALDTAITLFEQDDELTSPGTDTWLWHHEARALLAPPSTAPKAPRRWSRE